MEENPFKNLKISSSEFLNSLENRTECPKCLKSRKFYCYNCFVPVKGTEDLIPKVHLPLKIDIIKHPNECDGKSTSAHAAVLAPDDVRVFTYPCIPDYPDRNKVVLVFPGKNSLTMEEMAKRINKNDSYNDCAGDSQHDSPNTDMKRHDSKLGESDDEEEESKSVSDETTVTMEGKSDKGLPSKRKAEDHPGRQKKIRSSKQTVPFERAVFVDSTWQQTKGIVADDRLKDMTCIQLESRETKFWRHQKDNPATYLSTIEAVYYLVRDYHDLFVNDSYNGEYDNLLFFFTFMYQKIRKMYDGGKDLKAYKQRMINSSGSETVK
ncbi:tRNA-uridine aminocarboxypropyltransferase 1-like [Ostrea edulis]|uniref:tRNA-uridine aminocarboxypropyltransferase 1-like n=1 Tax=Ostrea edulis TaxID=37623 RepID=UPI0024AF494E|nr:tRNA-uridine aminocarboxypropyltransferase 1-like [Ostrea edulis]XP_055996488.1 tRNA-uridine aminocarboxypropyltransferase 1-like [Ostrea edulis]